MPDAPPPAESSSTPLVKPPFEQQIPIVEEQIRRRRHRWRLPYPTFEDVVQMVTVHVFQKYDTFDPSRGRREDTVEIRFLKWVNKLISSQMTNLLRNNYSKWQRPCIKCAFNTGNNSCSKTASKTQSTECKFYRQWKKRKEAQFNIKQTLAMEYHSQEVENYQGDFVDAAKVKPIIDAKMRERLTDFEWSVYRMLYIEYRTEREVGKKLKLKKVGKDGRLYQGYLVILKLRHKFVALVQSIIEDENLVPHE